jgi:hypothetical protein
MREKEIVWRERRKREKEVLFTAFKSCRATRHEMAQLKKQRTRPGLSADLARPDSQRYQPAS